MPEMSFVTLLLLLSCRKIGCCAPTCHSHFSSIAITQFCNHSNCRTTSTCIQTEQFLFVDQCIHSLFFLRLVALSSSSSPRSEEEEEEKILLLLLLLLLLLQGSSGIVGTIIDESFLFFRFSALFLYILFVVSYQCSRYDEQYQY